jgi:hypothetical protein
MNTAFRTMTVAIGVGAVAAGFAIQANAGCSYPAQKAVPSLWQQPLLGQGQAQLMPAAFIQVSNEASNGSIVGLWKFAFTAKGNVSPPGPPDGAPIDSGYVTWHSDGTELMNSGRAPTTGDFCMGVWKQIGASTYKLNHFALAWEFDVNAPANGPGEGGADFVGPANIREVVTVDRSGMSYHGTFELVQYNDDHTKVLADIVGTVKGTRITVNSGIDD